MLDCNAMHYALKTLIECADRVHETAKTEQKIESAHER